MKYLLIILLGIISSCEFNEADDFPTQYEGLRVNAITRQKNGLCTIKVHQEKESIHGDPYTRDRYFEDCPCNKWDIGDTVTLN